MAGLQKPKSESSTKSQSRMKVVDVGRNLVPNIWTTDGESTACLLTRRRVWKYEISHIVKLLKFSVNSCKSYPFPSLVVHPSDPSTHVSNKSPFSLSSAIFNGWNVQGTKCTAGQWRNVKKAKHPQFNVPICTINNAQISAKIYGIEVSLQAKKLSTFTSVISLNH